MNHGDSVFVPVFVKPSGKRSPWARPANVPPAGCPTIIGIYEGILGSSFRIRLADQTNYPGVTLVSHVYDVAGKLWDAQSVSQAVPAPAPTPAAAPVASQAGTPVYAAAKPFTAKAPSGFTATASAPIQQKSASSFETGGQVCSGACKQFCPYAEPNQPDGRFVCYSCRRDPFRAVFRTT